MNRQLPDLNDPAVQESFRASARNYAEKLLVERAQRDAFYLSPRFNEIATYITTLPNGIDQDDLDYFPEKFNVTAAEFGDFCQSAFEQNAGAVIREKAAFPTFTLDLDKLLITLMIGQGSVFFAMPKP